MATDLKYEINPELTGISLAYHNTDYIADKILPRVAVAQTSFRYRKFADDAFINIADTEVGRKGMPNQLDVKSELLDASVKSHALEAEVPQEDIEELAAAGADEDLMQDNTTLVTDGLNLAREVRTAEKLCNTANYNGNYKTLSGDDQLDKKTSSIIDVWKDVKKHMLMAPTHMVVSDTYALYLQSHPEFLSMCKMYESDAKGLVPLEFIRQQLGLKEILIGKAKVNAAKKGQTATIKDVWGRDLIFAYINPLAKPKQGLTFGYTAEKGKREIQTFYDGRPGSHGVHYIKAVENVNEIIAATSCGMLIKDAFANN